MLAEAAAAWVVRSPYRYVFPDAPMLTSPAVISTLLTLNEVLLAQFINPPLTISLLICWYLPLRSNSPELLMVTWAPVLSW